MKRPLWRNIVALIIDITLWVVSMIALLSPQTIAYLIGQTLTVGSLSLAMTVVQAVSLWLFSTTTLNHLGHILWHLGCWFWNQPLRHYFIFESAGSVGKLFRFLFIHTLVVGLVFSVPHWSSGAAWGFLSHEYMKVVGFVALGYFVLEFILLGLHHFLNHNATWKSQNPWLKNFVFLTNLFFLPFFHPHTATNLMGLKCHTEAMFKALWFHGGNNGSHTNHQGLENRLLYFKNLVLEYKPPQSNDEIAKKSRYKKYLFLLSFLSLASLVTFTILHLKGIALVQPIWAQILLYTGDLLSLCLSFYLLPQVLRPLSGGHETTTFLTSISHQLFLDPKRYLSKHDGNRTYGPQIKVDNEIQKHPDDAHFIQTAYSIKKNPFYLLFFSGNNKYIANNFKTATAIYDQKPSTSFLSYDQKSKLRPLTTLLHLSKQRANEIRPSPTYL